MHSCTHTLNLANKYRSASNGSGSKTPNQWPLVCSASRRGRRRRKVFEEEEEIDMEEGQEGQ
jgi:hypothetical protein